MRKYALWLLMGALVACNRAADGPDPQLRHQYDAAYQRQAKLLQADKIDLLVVHPVPTKPKLTLLTISVMNPQQPAVPDSLRLRLRKLAHLVVTDLANPADFEALNVQVRYRHGLLKTADDSSHTLIFPLAGLR